MSVDFRMQLLCFEISALLRSMKWNANLILLCDYGELVALYKVIGWEIHIPNIPEGRKNGHPA